MKEGERNEMPTVLDFSSTQPIETNHLTSTFAKLDERLNFGLTQSGRNVQNSRGKSRADIGAME
jgi:hypothetical protein